MPAFRAPSNHSDSGYSSKTAATLNSTISSKSSGKKLEKPRYTLRLDTSQATAGRQSASTDARKKPSSTVAQFNKPSNKPNPQPKRSESAGQDNCGDPNCRERGTSTAATPTSATPSWSPGYYYNNNTANPIYQQYQQSLPSPSPQASYPPASYSFPVPAAQPRRRSLSTSGYRPASYHSGTSPLGYWVEASPSSLSDAHGPPASSSAYNNPQSMPVSYHQNAPSHTVPPYSSGVSNRLPINHPSHHHAQRPTIPHRPTTGNVRPASINGGTPPRLYDSAAPSHCHTPNTQPYHTHTTMNASLAGDYDDLEPCFCDTEPGSIHQSHGPVPSLPARSSSRSYRIPEHPHGVPSAPLRLEQVELDPNRTIRPQRRESLQRPGILKASSFQTTSDTTSNRSYPSGLSSRYDPRAELVKRNTSDAEAYMRATETAGHDGRMRRKGQEAVTSQALQRRDEAMAEASKQHQRRQSRTTSTSHSRRLSSHGDGSQSNMSTSTTDSGAVKLLIPGREGFKMELSGEMNGRTISFGPSGEGSDVQEVTIGNGSPTSSKRDGEPRGRSERGSRSGSSYSDRVGRASIRAGESARHS